MSNWAKFQDSVKHFWHADVTKRNITASKEPQLHNDVVGNCEALGYDNKKCYYIMAQHANLKVSILINILDGLPIRIRERKFFIAFSFVS